MTEERECICGHDYCYICGICLRCYGDDVDVCADGGPHHVGEED